MVIFIVVVVVVVGLGIVDHWLVLIIPLFSSIYILSCFILV